MASRDYLSPMTGPGLRPAVVRGTGPSPHGRVVNPPRMAAFGGFTSPNVSGGPSTNMMGIRKPGSSEK